MPAEFKFFPFDNQECWEEEWREMMQRMRSTGILVSGSKMEGISGDCAVTPGTGLQVKIAPGCAWVRGHMWKHTGGAAFLPIYANHSGNVRTDLIVLRADFSNNVMQYMVLQGTKTPVQNAVVWDLPLAMVHVPNDATEIQETDIVDQRVSANQATFRPACICRNTTNRSIATGDNVTLKWDLVDVDTMNMYREDQIVVQEDGIYEVGCTTVWETVRKSDNIRRITIYRKREGALDAIAYGSTRGPGVHHIDVEVSARRVIDLQRGDALYVVAYNDSGATVSIKSVSLYSPVFWVVKIGGFRD